mgnify:FL=1
MVAEVVLATHEIPYIPVRARTSRSKDRISPPKVPSSIERTTSFEGAKAYVIGERGKFWDGKTQGRRIPRWEANAHLRQRLGAELNTLFEESGDDSSVGQIIDWYIQAITLHVPLIDSPATQGLKETTAESFIRERQEILASRGLISSATVKPA